jgi:hypothetical protein
LNAAWGSEPVPHDAISALGIDTGPHTGMFAAWWHPGEGRLLWALAFETSADCAPGMLALLLEYRGCPILRQAQLEDFRIAPGGRGSKLRGASANGIQEGAARLLSVLDQASVPVRFAAAGNVKPWATDRLLQAAGLWGVAGTSAHVRDAARHCLFAAVRSGQLPDPLSARAAQVKESTP